jgi:hypothetical protein
MRIRTVRRELALYLIGFAVLSPGCSLVCNATHNLVNETRRCADDYWEDVRERRLARDHWGMVAASSPGRVFSEDFVSGFEDGFVDFVHNGGAGLPPPLPPDRYRQVYYETPEGHVAIEQWFDGFRDGAAAARASGYRQFVTMPVAFAQPPVVPPQPHALHPGALPPTPANQFLPSDQQLPVLPAPRQVEPRQSNTGPKTVLWPPVALHHPTAPAARTEREQPELSPVALIRSIEPGIDPVAVLTVSVPVPDDGDDDGDDDDAGDTEATAGGPDELPVTGK